ncbi:3'-5' exonuclease [Bacteroidales bacterium OttesenSCG-928-K03]|nr:3'-5' exonuclease [Odoribacter sp. OttesenSCG-928-L07]MDL2239492.1 3'-5' exonuclease [Bacteroidales bacterium OttesenSCG-928-L14]MDL2240450.1 3'-5' exonuclease [Bacteroidales bacterium OttesenSCG-928-K22]MDL2242960.1 3'-5' exonuclease [Bacteroidales bacterium OttesenSCG-928-K03]
MQINLKRPIVFFDLETTGLSITKDKIIELAMLKVNVDNSTKEKTWMINPEMPIPYESSVIHNITDEDVIDKPTFKQVAKEIAEFIGNADLAGFNAIKFDIPFLVEEFLKAGVDFKIRDRKFVDVQNIFHKMEPRNLSAAYKFYCDSEIVDAHRAMNDTKATYEIFLAQLERYENTEIKDKFGKNCTPVVNDIDKLSDFTHQTKSVDLAGYIIYNDNGQEIFTFGKHKNRPVREVFGFEPQYYDWIVKSDFPEYTKKVLTRIYTEMKQGDGFKLF